MIQEKISIVIVCYKEGKLLQRALDSVFAQDDRDFELVVVKNASSCDETLRICKGLEGIENVRVVYRDTNEGNVAARNDGFKVASGDVLIPLDGDDDLPTYVVATVKKVFAAHPDADFIFSDYRLVNVETGESKIIDGSAIADDQGWLVGQRFAAGTMFLGTTSCRRSTWQRVGGYKGSLYGWQDVEFWMRVIASGARGLYVNKVLYTWYRSIKGVNASTPQFRLWEVHLNSRTFHQMFGDWGMVCEGFLHYAANQFESPQTRKLMRSNWWRLFQGSRSLLPLYFRALMKCIFPPVLVSAIVNIKRKPEA